MSWNVSEFRDNLEKAVSAFDRDAAAALCEQLINHLSATAEPYPEDEALKILSLLRRKRMFALLQKVAKALMESGQKTYQVRRQYAQGLIDGGNITEANTVLDALISDTGADPSEKAAKENAEARGLKGRAYKQLYINAEDRTTEEVMEYLRRAVSWYSDVYQSAPGKHLWHGINVVALLMLAQREGVEIEGFSKPENLAQGILTVIEAKKDEAAQWDFGTAVEACVALGKLKEAEVWLGKYVKAQHEKFADAFELASTLRQFEEVWQLKITTPMGKRILPVLRAELLTREGGQVTLSVQDLLPENKDPFPDTGNYESRFGNAAFDSYQSLLIGMARARAVAQISKELASQGSGTGFLVKGTELNPKYGDDLILLTNNHVISNDMKVREAHKALHPSEAVITFEALGGKETYRVKEFLWGSPPEELDASVIRLDKPIDETDLYPLAEVLPVIDEQARVYIIGHPRGGKLNYSIQDNLLLHYLEPPVYIHYRTPTEPGSSGSPIFNREWKLIGLHHAGGPRPKLDNKAEKHQANEGIWIRAIIEAIAKEVAKTPEKNSPKTKKATKKASKMGKKAKGK